MRIFLFFLFIQVALFGRAQDHCASQEYITAIRQSASAEFKTIEKAETFLEKINTQKMVAEDAVIRIPVVVHVVYNQASQNISVAQIQSGIDALNRDFRRRNADAANTPQRFRHLAADVQIEFYLAKSDPQGRSTSGIERKSTSRMGWLADDKVKRSAQGGLDAWDSKSYLNIWICNLIAGSGYASVPGSATETDGIVINANSFGTIHTAAPFNMGRTAVHEVGHWLGLKHIWGDTQCGDDGVEDTPQQGFFTQGCPSDIRSSCNNGTAGDMYMNYMDYTNDACMNLFTTGQRLRMRSLFAEGGPRSSLLQSKGLMEPTKQESALPSTAAVYPNPATNSITFQVNTEMVGKKMTVLNSQGLVLHVQNIQKVQQSIDITFLKSGVYFLKSEGFTQKFIKL